MLGYAYQQGYHFKQILHFNPVCHPSYPLALVNVWTAMFTNLIHYNKLKFQESIFARNVATLSFPFRLPCTGNTPLSHKPSAPEVSDLAGKWFLWIPIWLKHPHIWVKKQNKNRCIFSSRIECFSECFCLCTSTPLCSDSWTAHKETQRPSPADSHPDQKSQYDWDLV